MKYLATTRKGAKRTAKYGLPNNDPEQINACQKALITMWAYKENKTTLLWYGYWYHEREHGNNQPLSCFYLQNLGFM